MLVLTRKIDQSILIGNEIEIKIIEIRGEQIKIGVSAPKNVAVFRKELLQEIASSNQDAVASTLPLSAFDSLKNLPLKNLKLSDAVKSSSPDKEGEKRDRS